MTDINANIHLKSEQDPKAKTILILLLCSEQNFLGTIVKCMNFNLNAHEVHYFEIQRIPLHRLWKLMYIMFVFFNKPCVTEH